MYGTEGTRKEREVSPREVRGLVVPPGNLAGRPPVSPHHALVICLPQLSELLDEVVDVLAGQGCRLGVGGRALHEGIRTRLGQIVLRRCSVPQPHEQELRVEALKNGAQRNM